MRKHIIAATVMAAALVVPAAAQAKPVTPQHHGAYLRAYHAVRHQFGPQQAGCNLIERRGSCHMNATDEAVVKSLGVLQRYLAPPPVRARHYTRHYVSYSVPVSRTSYRASYRPTYHSHRSYQASAASYGGSGYSIPSSIVQCESGGNYSAVNPSSGAGGAYQILPSTWHAHGGQGLPQDASPAEQGRIASEIWNGGQGRSQWSC